MQTPPSVVNVGKRKPDTLSKPDYLLCEAAVNTMKNAYAPYSGFAVGAAVRTKSGKIYLGANLENAVFGLGVCAEISALTAANSNGDYEIEAIAVAGLGFWPDVNAKAIVTPCGRCRQKIKEAADVSKIDIAVFCCNGDLSDIRSYKISDLLPDSFGPDVMGFGDKWPEMQKKLRSLK